MKVLSVAMRVEERNILDEYEAFKTCPHHDCLVVFNPNTVS